MHYLHYLIHSKYKIIASKHAELQLLGNSESRKQDSSESTSYALLRPYTYVCTYNRIAQVLFKLTSFIYSIA